MNFIEYGLINYEKNFVKIKFITFKNYLLIYEYIERIFN